MPHSDAPPKILVVEDEMTEAVVFKEHLTRAGYSVLIAPDGERALEMIKEQRPDLILLDIFLPKMNGVEVLKSMESDPALSKIPVIVVTNLSDSETANKILAIRNTDYIIKNEHIIEEILNRVEEKLRGDNSTDNEEQGSGEQAQGPVSI